MPRKKTKRTPRPATPRASFPQLREFLATSVAMVVAGTATLAEMDRLFDGFFEAQGMDENERAFAAELERLGIEEAPKVDIETPEYRQGYQDGYLAGFAPSLKVAAK